jgi:hypothetical protein
MLLDHGQHVALPRALASVDEKALAVAGLNFREQAVGLRDDLLSAEKRRRVATRGFSEPHHGIPWNAREYNGR